MNTKKVLGLVDTIISIFELVIAFSLLIIIAIKVFEVFSAMAGFRAVLLPMDFEKILSIILTLIIGIEFTKMLCRHTPEAVIDVLLFVIARQIIIYHDNVLDLLVGTVAIVGLYAAKYFFVDKIYKHTTQRQSD